LDINLFRINKKLHERKNIVGYIGRLSGDKGVLELAKAIPLVLLQKSDLSFLIVGDGPLIAEMKKELKRSGCLDKVDFVGWVPHKKLPDYFNEMRIHVLPSYTEAFGGTAIEAMACGAISIANSVGGMPDVIINNETGFLLKDNLPQTIADKVIEVWDNPELDKIQRNAEEFVEKTFSYEKAMERCKKVFCELVDA
jgi:glycosyltransferase involved in cell wall biosynthesis